MKDLLKLSPQWHERLHRLGETGMGYVVVTVILKNGQRIHRVAIVGDVIADIYGVNQIPFTEDDIADFVVTHDKWDFQTGKEIGEMPHP